MLTVCFSQEAEIDILATIQNLLRQCVQPSAFLRPLSKLFSIIHNKLPRQALTSVFQVQQRAELYILFVFVICDTMNLPLPQLNPPALLSDAVRSGAVPHIHH